MKMKKVLAAALAGTMVLGTAVTVSAETVTNYAWWQESANHVSTKQTISGDGTWTFAVTCEKGTVGVDGTESYEYTYNAEGTDYYVNLSDDVETAYAAFSIELYDAGNNGYITGGSDNNVWVAEGYGSGSSVSGANVTASEMKPGETYSVTITRAGNDFKIVIRNESTDTKLCQFKITPDVTASNDMLAYIMPQAGQFNVDFYEGEYNASGASSSESESTPATSESGSTPATSESESTPATTEKTGDAAPIVAVVVALAGCAAIAFASKKRFAK